MIMIIGVLLFQPPKKLKIVWCSKHTLKKVIGLDCSRFIFQKNVAITKQIEVCFSIYIAKFFLIVACLLIHFDFTCSP